MSWYKGDEFFGQRELDIFEPEIVNNIYLLEKRFFSDFSHRPLEEFAIGTSVMLPWGEKTDPSLRNILLRLNL